MTKCIRRKCYEYKVFNQVAFQKSSSGLLPRDQIEGSRAFSVAGSDCAGPITFNKKQKTEGKRYKLVFTYSLLREVHIEFLRNWTTGGFIQYSDWSNIRSDS